MALIVRNRLTFLSGILLLLWCTQLSYGQAQADKALLDRHLQPLETEADYVNALLSKISSDYGIPIGLEVATEGENPILSVVIQGRSLLDVLNDIVKQDPRYQWKMVDGVINVFPKSRRDPLLANILETQVHQFIIPKGSNVYKIRNGIVGIPEVKTKLEQAKVSPQIFAFTGLDFAKTGKDFSLDVSGATVLDILNLIIRKSDAKYWIVSRYGEHKEVFIINF